MSAGTVTFVCSSV